MRVFGQPHLEMTKIAASYLERGLGMVGALAYAGNVAVFAAGRSAAISWLVAWEREERGVPAATTDFDDAATDQHWATIVGIKIGDRREPSGARSS